jgi:hypothetical protein
MAAATHSPPEIYPDVNWNGGMTGDHVRLLISVGALYARMGSLRIFRFLASVLLELFPAEPRGDKFFGDRSHIKSWPSSARGTVR